MAERKPMLSVRVDAELLAWVRGYAVQRRASVSAVVNVALAELRELATAGVPDLELDLPRASGRVAKVRAAGGASSRRLASPGGPRPTPGDAPALERLDEVVAARLASAAGPNGGLLRALRMIRAGEVRVDGEVVRDRAALVAPASVSV